MAMAASGNIRNGSSGEREKKRSHYREQPQEDGHFQETIGADLSSARREKGLSLNDVAASLRLKSEHIQAIEESDFEALPGKTYAMGFVRAYAKLMGAKPGPEAEEFVRRFKAEMTGAEELKFNSMTRKDPRRRIPFGLLATGAMTFMLATFVWRMADTAIGAGDDLLDAYQPSLPRQVVRDTLLPGGERVALAPTDATNDQDPDLPEGAQDQMADVPNGMTWGAENHDSRIRMKALKDVWLRVEVDGRVMFERVLSTGDSYMPPNRGGTRIVTRNAGDLEIYVDGGYIRRLGGEGDALGGATLDPDALLAGR